jgi:cytochrome c biogenesis protein CcdA
VRTKPKGLRNALTYGGFILGIYLLFSVPFHLLGSVNPEIFNEISTNPWLNVFFFVIFLVFAVSFFGYFEITLPSSWVNSMDQKASKFGGLIGIFFMALTLALVSFSCTGPILGSLLAGALTSPMEALGS